MIQHAVVIGYQGEQNARYQDFDISDMLSDWPNAVPSIIHQRNGDTDAYIVPTTLTDTTLRWKFSAVDAEKVGLGTAQIIMTDSAGEIIGKSNKFHTIVRESIQAGEDVPEAMVPWVNSVLSTVTAGVTAVNTSKAEAAESATKAETAQEYAEDAQKKAEQAAEASMASHGMMTFQIDESGHLIYQATDSMDECTFSLENGRLVVMYGE